MKINILFLVTVLLLSSCVDKLATHYYGIKVRNTSQENIYVYSDIIFPDTTLSIHKPFLFTITPNGEALVKSESSNVNQYYENGELISVFVLNCDTVNFYDWNQIRESYNILKRYEFTQEEFDNTGEKLIYP